VGDVLQQVLVGITNLERAAGVNPENPIIPVLLVVGGTLYIGVSYWQARYGGYSGDLKPTSALDLLKKDGNVVLVDIRPQVEREDQGVPDLRRGARSRFAIVEIFKVGLTLDIVWFCPRTICVMSCFVLWRISTTFL
jgi:hypothetical protein